MADFDWLTRIPNDEWLRDTKLEGAERLTFTRKDFEARSSVAGDDWKAEFLIWASRQPRSYVATCCQGDTNEMEVWVVRLDSKFEGAIETFKYPDGTTRRIRLQSAPRDAERLSTGATFYVSETVVEDAVTGVRLTFVSYDEVMDEQGVTLTRV